MNINKITETIFNSSLANFKISVECAPERTTANNGSIPLVTVNDRGVCSIDSSIYLVFSYKGDNLTKNLYMSYPQIPQLISMMAPLADAVSRPAETDPNSAFCYVDGNLVVHPRHNEPYCLANIGKRLMALSIRPIVADLNGNNGTSKNEGAIEIRINDPEKSVNENALASVLSIDEFLNIFHQVKTLNLVELNAMFSLFYLQTKMIGGSFEVQQPRYNNNNNYNRQNNFGNNGNFQQNNYQQQYNNGFQGNNYQDSPAPRFNGGNNRPYNNKPQITRQAVQATPVNNNPQQPVQAQNNYQAPAAQPQPTNKIMNAREIDNTPISTITFDDAEEIDQLFSED